MAIRPKAAISAAEWKENGLCTACGKPAAPGRTLCEAHLERKRATYRAKRAQGLCGTCNRPLDAETGHGTYCSAYAKGWREAQKENARCTSCGQPALPGLTSCAGCAQGDRAKMERVREQRRAAGLCPTCGGDPEPGAVTCRACNDRTAAWYKHRKAAGLCIDCDDVAVPGKTKCEPCLRADVEQTDGAVPRYRYRPRARAAAPSRVFGLASLPVWALCRADGRGARHWTSRPCPCGRDEYGGQVRNAGLLASLPVWA